MRVKWKPNFDFIFRFSFCHWDVLCRWIIQFMNVNSYCNDIFTNIWIKKTKNLMRFFMTTKHQFYLKYLQCVFAFMHVILFTLYSLGWNVHLSPEMKHQMFHRSMPNWLVYGKPDNCATKINRFIDIQRWLWISDSFPFLFVKIKPLKLNYSTGE